MKDKDGIVLTLSCNELSDIYMALNVVIELFGKNDLERLRDKVAKLFSEKCVEHG